MKKFLLLLTFVPTVLFAQAPWRPFAQRADKPGYGIWGIGNKSSFTRIEGKSNSHGRPGTGKDVCDFWYWEDERFVKHEAYIIGENFLGNRVDKKGPYELQVINEDGSCTWGEGTIKKLANINCYFHVVEGVYYNGTNKMLFSGKSLYGTDNFIDGVLIDCTRRLQQKWKKEKPVGNWGPLDNTSAALLEKYGPDYGLISLKEKHPDTFALVFSNAREILQKAIRNPRGGQTRFDDYPSLIGYFNKYPYMQYVLTQQEIEDIVNSFIRLLRENNNSRNLVNIHENVPAIVYDNPTFKTTVFRQLTSDSFLGTGYTAGGLTQADYYSIYHDYADLTREEINALDDSVFGRVAVITDLEYYMKLFPAGRHIDEVRNLYSGGTGEGLYRKQIASLRNDFVTEMRAAISGMTYGTNPSVFDYSGYPLIGTIISGDSKDSKLAYYKVICSNLKKQYTDNRDVQAVIETTENYIHIIDGFWAVENSKDMEACVGRDFLQSIITPLTSVTLTSQGKEVKSRFESALKTIEFLEGEDWEDMLLLDTYLYLYDIYADYIKKVNGELISKNESVNRRERDNSVLWEYKFDDDGCLVIILKNGDSYSYEMKDGYWRLKYGNHIAGTKVDYFHRTVQSAITASEQMDYEFWSTPVQYR